MSEQLAALCADPCLIATASRPPHSPVLKGLGVPGPVDLQAAWRGLPIETRDRIGAIALEFALYTIVDCQGVTENDFEVLGRTKAVAVQAAAEEQSNVAMDDLFNAAEAALPAVFGRLGGGAELGSA
ncbi:hypothetical protein [Methylobacterium sp. Leaf466]|uniref:hypothetical protein n=1 Tax=Methylobacterium sp. Leaf466 TaxID=1736386 RepID=UPI0006F6EF05|nr:hypothetical protein [Methylobacterium sp. Leaf466]KQT78375.1 hypothetical protein ASG59_07755 [Methylobacterium sp. Leaf466]